MYGQGSYAPQFRQGPPANSPQFQQGHPPPFQQGPPPPPPPPPVNHEGRAAAPSGLVQPTHHHHIYQHGPPPPPSPFQQGGPPPRLSQPYFHPSSSGYMNPPMTLSSTNLQQNAHFPSPMPPPGPTVTGPSKPETVRAPLPPRVFPPPLSQGQMLYVTPRHPPPPSIGQGIQHGQLLPPPPSSFVPVTPAPFVSLPQAPPEHAQPPSMPPPPPPPPPSSPPPLIPPPPPPPPASSPDFSTRSSLTSSFVPLDASCSIPQHLQSGSVTNRITDISESAIDSMDKGAGPTCTSDDLPASGDYLTIDAGTISDLSMVEDKLSSKTQSALAVPPPKPSEKGIVRQIEVLCQYIVKNGPDFEITARTKERGNPKFAFLFGGEPGSEAAIAHEYFQWMKKKSLMEFKLCIGSEHIGSPPRSSEIASSICPNIYTNEDACHSPADSDMDMEDDTHQFNEDQDVGAPVKVSKEPVSIYEEVLNVKEQRPENQHSKDDPTAPNASSRIESSYDISVLAREEREHDHIPLPSSDGDSECTLNISTQKLTRPIEDLTPPKASPAAACINYEVSDPLSKIGSPFRLIQGYASDDSGEADDGPSFEDVSPEMVSPSIRTDNTILHEEEGTKLEMDTGSVSTPMSEKELASLTESSFLCSGDTPSRMPNISTEAPKVVEATVVPSGPSGAIANTDELHNDNHDCRRSNSLAQGDSVRGNGDADSQSGKFERGGDKQDSAVLKVDEFGRMVREGGSDSDSDVEHHSGRRYRRGRSRSPLDRRRRSRSPRRRNEKRNRSRSWSPRKRRSTSRSPSAFRHTGEFSGEKIRRDRDQRPDCFDFLKGKCGRGSSCRFLHRRPGTGDAARRYRSRHQQHVEDPQDLRKSNVRGDSHSSVETHEVNVIPAKNELDTLEEDATRTKVPCSDFDVISIDVPKDRRLDEKTDAGTSTDDVQPVTSIEVAQSATTVIEKVCKSDYQEAIEQGLDNRQVQQVLEAPTVVEGNEISKLPEEISQPLPTNEAEIQDMSDRTPSTEPSLPDTAVSHPSKSMFPNGEASETNDSTLCAEQPLPAQNINASIPFPPESFAPQHLAPGEFHAPHFSAENYQFQHSQLPLPPPPPLLTAQVSQPLREYNLPPVVTNVYSQSASVERYPPYHAPLNDQYSQSSAPSNISWTSQPPPPPYAHGSTSAVSHTQGFHQMQFQQNPLPLMRPYQHGQPSHSQSIEFRPPAFHPTGELHRPPLHTEGISHSQPLEYPKVFRDERFPPPLVLDGNRFHPGPPQVPSIHPPHQLREENHFPLQVHDGTRNFQSLPNQRFMHTHTVPFPNESPAKHLQTFPDRNSHHNSILREDFGTSTSNQSFTHQQQPTSGMQWSGAISYPSHLGSAEHVGPSIRRYPNPFASTFENIPDSSKYKSNFKQESLTADSNRSGGQILPKSGDPYDPLFDSIEPSSKSSRKFERIEGGNLTGDVISKSVAARPTVDSLITKSNYSHGNMEEKERIEGASAAITTSPENDEFGETAVDTEVGAMESESPDNPIDIADKAMGDVEIDQVQSKGKSKKSKDSRSMKLFKVSLADFVKDVLKPSWRQGNMSKEAFKTIVKKTVDKVAGAMKNNQIPKGQAKIDQYVESSQRKLTKLVMGYVDKYVKA